MNIYAANNYAIKYIKKQVTELQEEINQQLYLRILTNSSMKLTYQQKKKKKKPTEKCRRPEQQVTCLTK